ncbi:hypothetical protein CYMTET_16812 [Cymbomonas tetramitiformis]|uniref:LNR domain-containing protein n=1 Tax=Cymbomonas tetramitiformis TaxID=36881 RepID=A0AAE0GBB7_9CHLO|nr:hypothetical protein CYMTET_16812 [Cymbomonas tetramitiformis]
MTIFKRATFLSCLVAFACTSTFAFSREFQGNDALDILEAKKLKAAELKKIMKKKEFIRKMHLKKKVNSESEPSRGRKLHEVSGYTSMGVGNCLDASGNQYDVMYIDEGKTQEDCAADCITLAASCVGMNRKVDETGHCELRVLDGASLESSVPTGYSQWNVPSPSTAGTGPIMGADGDTSKQCWKKIDDTNDAECTAAGCPANWQGDGYCDAMCEIEVCHMDNGDCAGNTDTNTPECTTAGCPANWQGDGFCDDDCNIEACQMDNGDCAGAPPPGEVTDTNTPECTSEGCPANWQGDGFCDDSCYIEACNLDNGDCAAGAPPGMFANTLSSSSTTGTCPVGKSSVTVSVATGINAAQLRWALLSCSAADCAREPYTTYEETVLTSAGVVKSGGGSADLLAPFTDYMTYVYTECLTDGESYKLALYNSGGQGWYTGSIGVQSAAGVFLAGTSGNITSDPFFEKLKGPFTPSGTADVTCDAGSALLTVHVTTGDTAARNAWELRTHPGETVLLSAGLSGELYPHTSYIHKICVPSSETLFYKATLLSEDSTGWGGGSILVAKGDQGLAAGPVSQSGWAREDVGPFLATSVDMSSYSYLLATGAGTGYTGSRHLLQDDGGVGRDRFDGEYQPLMMKSGSPAYVRYSSEVGLKPKYLYKSTVYPDYWVIATDLYSGNMYGYVYDPPASDPTQITVQWDASGINTAGISFSNVEATPVASTPTPTPAPSPAPTPCSHPAPTGSCIAGGVPYDSMTAALKELIGDLRQNGTLGRVAPLLRTFLEELLPADIHTRMTQRSISVKPHAATLGHILDN